MSRVSNIEAAILGLLYEQSLYGYKLEKIIEERGMRNWTEIGFSSIYYVLKRLEKKEFITSELESVKGKPSRKIYTTTKKGKLAMEEKVKTLLSENKKILSPLDIGIAYLKTLKTEEVLECLHQYLKSTDNKIHFLEESIKYMDDTNTPYFVTAIFTRPLSQLEAEKLWIKEFIIKIEAEEYNLSLNDENGED